jgi:hypothetical protein
MKNVLILLALSGPALAQIASHPYIGAGGCASSNCHGGTSAAPAGESRILGNEYATWSTADKHARAYKALEEARGKRMAEILGIADAARQALHGRPISRAPMASPAKPATVPPWLGHTRSPTPTRPA